MIESKPRESVKVLFVTQNPIKTALYLEPHWCALDKPFNGMIPFIEKSYADKLQAEIQSLKAREIAHLALIQDSRKRIKSKDELLRECEKALMFYGDENKWFMRTKIIDPTKDVIFASRYNDKTGQSEAVDIKEPFESKSFEVTARLKIDQGKTAQAMLQKLREGKN